MPHGSMYSYSIVNRPFCFDLYTYSVIRLLTRSKSNYCSTRIDILCIYVDEYQRIV